MYNRNKFYNQHPEEIKDIDTQEDFRKLKNKVYRQMCVNRI